MSPYIPLLLPLILIPLIFYFVIRQLLHLSANYRLKYHELDEQWVADIVKQPQRVLFVEGLRSIFEAKSYQLTLSDKGLLLKADDSTDIREVVLSDIRKIESPDPGTLIMYPQSMKFFAGINDGRLGMYFGDTKFGMAYNTTPFKRFKLLKTDSKVLEADKRALAFYIEIKRRLDLQRQ